MAMMTIDNLELDNFRVPPLTTSTSAGVTTNNADSETPFNIY